jgi:16S rRNA (guanine966-N2)-methyltransferase
MRIIAGQFKGRRLAGPVGTGVRPTSDRLRETLFNVLAPVVAGARVLDGYAGTGAVGLEALSRGAAHVTFVERDRRTSDLLMKNVDACRAQDACAIIRDDFVGGRWSGRATVDLFDLVLLDPPYDVPDLDAVVAAGTGVLAASGRLVLEHSRRRESPTRAGGWRRVRVLTAGDSALSFYERAGDDVD